MDFQYLKEKSYYEDLYDFFTIKDCLRDVDFWLKAIKKRSKDKEINSLSNEEKKKGFSQFSNLQLNINKGERYRRKAETINEWMARDKVKQDKFDNAMEPMGIICDKCKAPMKSTFKQLEDFTDKPLRVFYFYSCPKCDKRKCVYENGEEWKSTPPTCAKCGKSAKQTHSKKGNIITWTTTCLHCKHKEVSVDDLDKKDTKWEEEQKKDKLLLETYRSRFCLSDKDGREYIETMEKLELASKIREEAKAKYEHPTYQKVIHLKKQTIVDLEKHLFKNLEKKGFIKLALGNPIMDQFVHVPFTTQESNKSRSNHQSILELQNILKPLLEKINWRLVSNSITYRLGYLSGQLKGYERDEDLINLEYGGIKQEVKLTKEEEEKRFKYMGDPIIQLAKMQGEFEAIEEMRKERLKKEPKGFLLDGPDKRYTCGLCGDQTPGDRTWWNLEGLRCADCWRNMEEGVIPHLKDRYESDDVYFQDWQLDSEFGVKHMTARKLRRLGILHGRELKRKDGGVYHTIYLLKENKEFLKQYPRKPKMRFIYKDPLGREIEL